MNLLFGLVTTAAGVTAIYLSWRHARIWSRAMALAGWLLVCAAAVWWVRFRGAEHGLAFAAIALSFGAWAFVALAGRERPRPGDRRRLPRVAASIAGSIPGRSAIAATLGRVFVAFPLAGTASLLASVLIAASLPWGIVDRYVFAMLITPIIWGVLAMWAGMTVRLLRTAFLLAGVSATCAALLFSR